MNIFRMLLRSIFAKPILALALLWMVTSVSHAETNDVLISSVELDAEQNIDLYPGDPIKYTVTYERETANPGSTHQRQDVRISVMLSTDGDPHNVNNYVLFFFDDVFMNNISAGETRTQVVVNRLPANFTGTYFLIAKIHGIGGGIVSNPPGDPDATNNFPSYAATSTARVVIRSKDSPTVSRISTSISGGDANELSESPAVTADGRYVVFHSEATDLVQSPVVPAGISQIYLRDMVTNEVRLISQLGGVPGNAESKYPVISATGSDDPATGKKRLFIAYQSAATNLISGVGNTDTNGQTDIFLYDMGNGVTSLISNSYKDSPSGRVRNEQGNLGSYLPSISDDGSKVAFESDAETLLGRRANGDHVDTNKKSDIYVYDHVNKVVTAVSATATSVPGQEVLGNADSTHAKISGDGRTVVFRSTAANLVIPNAGQGALSNAEIFAKTLVPGSSAGIVSRISVLRNSNTGAIRVLNSESYDPAVSRDGRYVAFASRASNIQAPNGDYNLEKISQVYVVNRAVNLPVGVTEPSPEHFDQVGNVSLNLVSMSVTPLSPDYGFANDESLAPMISKDGRYIGFHTQASDLLPSVIFRSDGRAFQTNISGVVDIEVNDEGMDPIDTPVVTIEDRTGAGSGAEAMAVVANGQILQIAVTNPGQGYSNAPDAVVVSITGGNGFGAEATATVGTGNREGQITAINVTNPGFNYANVAFVLLEGGGGSGASATAILDGMGGIEEVTVDDNGFGYLIRNTSIVFSPPDDIQNGWEPLAVPVIENGRIYDIVVFDPGWGYSAAPQVEIVSEPISPARATVVMAANRIFYVSIDDTGSGYTTPPKVQILVGNKLYPIDPNDSDLPQHRAVIADHLEETLVEVDGQYYIAQTEDVIWGYVDQNYSADVYVKDTAIKSILLVSGGSGYTSSFTVDETHIQGGGGSGVKGWAIVQDGTISRIDLLDGGAGYLNESTITVTLPTPSGGVAGIAKASLREGADRISLNHFGEETMGILGGFHVPSARNITMSADGRYMLFVSEAHNSAGFIFGKSNQIPLDSNGKRDIFMVDRRIDTPVTPVQGVAPTVVLQMETRDVTFDSTRVISVTAFDGGDVDEVNGLPVEGVVRKVQVFANGLLVAEKEGSSSRLDLETTWTAPRLAGPAEIYAVAIDGNGNRIFSVSNIVQVVAPASQRPAITLSSSSTTLTIGESVVLTAAVSDPENQIAYVNFYSNGQLLFTDVAPPYTYTFTPTSSGTYKLTAIVVDGVPPQVGEDGEVIVGGVSNDAISNELTLAVLPPPAPTVQIVSPSGGTTVGSVGQPIFIEVTASTSNPNASISRVTLRANGSQLPGTAVRVGTTSSYRYTWTPASAGTFSLTATASDSQQGVGTSSAREFTILPAVITGPAVSITSPTTGAVLFTNEEQALFRFSASDPNGSVSSVVLYGNGAKIGNATFNSSSGQWELFVNVSLLSPGVYAFQALAQDNEGNVGSSGVLSVQVSTPLPLVSIKSPLPVGGIIDAKRGQPLHILIEAKTVDVLSRITNIGVSVDGVSIGEADRVGNTDEYSIVWTPDLTGIFRLLATATDSKGGSVQTSEISIRVTEPVGVAPFVGMVFPDESPFTVTTLSELIVSVIAVDSDGSLTGVDIYINNRLLGPAELVGGNIYNRYMSFVGTAPGVYNVTALARDNSGNVTMSQPAVFVVQPAVGPTFTSVTLTATGAAIRGQVGNFSVSGIHPTGTIQSVYFLANGTPFADEEDEPNPVTTPPFSTSRVYPAGTFKISALVYDNYGNTKVTNEILQVVENNKAPTIRVTAPVAGSSFIFGNPIVLEAEAIALDPGDVVESVSFYANGLKLNIDPDDGTGGDDAGPVVTQVAGTNYWQFTWIPEISGSYSIIAEAVTRGGSGQSEGNYPMSAVSSPVSITVISVAVISDLYQKIVGRAATAGEIEAVVELFGLNVTSGQMAEYLLKSDDFTNGNAKLIFMNLGVFGRYPTNSELASLRMQRELYESDVEFVDSLLLSPTYTQLYGSMLNLITTTPQQYSYIRDFALRSAANLGDSRSDQTAFIQRFYHRITDLGLSPGQALVDYWNDGFRGLDAPGGSPTLSLISAQSSALARVRVAGAILAFSNIRPDTTKIASFNGYSLRQVSNYYIAGGTGTASTIIPILDWRETNFGTVLNSGNAADSADFDGDGIPNLLEYAFRSDPKARNSNPIVTSRTANGQFLTLTFPRVVNSGLSYRIEASSNLSAGFSATGTSYSGTGANVTYTDNVSLLTPNTRRFLRVVVSY